MRRRLRPSPSAISIGRRCFRYILCETAPKRSAESIAEHPCILRALSVEYPRLIEQQVRGVLFENAVVIAQRCECHDDVVTRINFQYWFCGSFEPSRTGQQLLQLAVGAMFGGDQANGAVRQSVRGTNICDSLAKSFLDEGKKTRDRFYRLGSRFLLRIDPRDKR